MLKELRPAATVLTVLTVLTGVFYPALVTGIGAAVFPRQAAGSLVTAADGRILGSRLIGQQFTSPRYFWGRLSATSPAYNAAASTGSNLGPLNPALAQAVKSRVDALRAADPSATGPIPVDLVTASGSGLDPQISPAAAEFQLARVARLRALSIDTLRTLVARHTEARTFGVLGEPRVNVLALNLALDGIAPGKP